MVFMSNGEQMMVNKTRDFCFIQVLQKLRNLGKTKILTINFEDDYFQNTTLVFSIKAGRLCKVYNICFSQLHNIKPFTLSGLEINRLFGLVLSIMGMEPSRLISSVKSEP